VNEKSLNLEKTTSICIVINICYTPSNKLYVCSVMIFSTLTEEMVGFSGECIIYVSNHIKQRFVKSTVLHCTLDSTDFLSIILYSVRKAVVENHEA